MEILAAGGEQSVFGGGGGGWTAGKTSRFTSQKLWAGLSLYGFCSEAFS